MAGRSGAGTRDLAVSGHVNIDRFLRVRRFPGLDRTEPVASSRVELGGTAANIALVAAERGVRVGLLSRIGDGFPEAFLRRLKRAGVTPLACSSSRADRPRRATSSRTRGADSGR